MDTGPVGLVFPIAGGPFSAEQREERRRMFPGGTSRSETILSQIYRDRAGRVRIELRFTAMTVSRLASSTGLTRLLTRW
jgi:hypothetical protein